MSHDQLKPIRVEEVLLVMFIELVVVAVNRFRYSLLSDAV